MEEDHATDDKLQIGESIRYSYFTRLPSTLISFRQIASSDVILLNKTDLADGFTLAQTEIFIRQINPFAPIHRTVRGEVELDKILGVAAFRKPPMTTGVDAQHVHSEECGHDEAKTHYQIRGISSLQVHCPILLSQSQLDELDEWIRNALWENRVRIRPGDDRKVQILRCKGLFGDEKGRWWVLQGVRSMYEISELRDVGVDVPDRGKIVLIGKGLDENVRVNLGSILGS
jgi:G3E family GTPase